MVHPLPERRREGRQRILVGVRCRIAPGQSPEVHLTEISVTGCQIVIREGLLKTAQHVVIKARGLEGLPGTVRWVLGDAVGIAFEHPLHPAVLAHLLDGGGTQPALYQPRPTDDPHNRPLAARSATAIRSRMPRSCL